MLKRYDIACDASCAAACSGYCFAEDDGHALEAFRAAHKFCPTDSLMMKNLTILGCTNINAEKPEFNHRKLVRHSKHVLAYRSFLQRLCGMRASMLESGIEASDPLYCACLFSIASLTKNIEYLKRELESVVEVQHE